MELSFDEIKNGNQFEDLVSEYFNLLKKNPKESLRNVDILPSGEGTDGGRDILLNFELDDGIVSFKRRWVVQCKFHKKSISTDSISNINIPTLIHAYNAVGYILICREKPTSKLTNLFEELSKNCRHKYQYQIWTGSKFKGEILNFQQLLKQFFPKYFLYAKQNKII